MPSASTVDFSLPPVNVNESLVNCNSVNENSSNSTTENYVIPLDGLVKGIIFPSKEVAIKAVKSWCDDTFTPFVKKVNQGTLDAGGNEKIIRLSTNRHQLVLSIIYFNIIS